MENISETGADIPQTEGFCTEAKGYNSHAEGDMTKANGDGSHAEGFDTIADGLASHAEGSNTKCVGKVSHAEGGGTIANGNYSHTEGVLTQANGSYSHTEGYLTIAENHYEHAQGALNVSHASIDNAEDKCTIHSIGIGKEPLQRKNAVEVMQNGDVYINGIGDYDGIDYKSAQTLQELINLQTKLIQELKAKVDRLTTTVDGLNECLINSGLSFIASDKL